MFPKKTIIAGPVYLRMTVEASSIEGEPTHDTRELEKVFDSEGVTVDVTGSAAETGLVLNRLGVPTRLGGKVGDDQMGEAVIEYFRKISPNLVEGLVIDPSVKTGGIIHNDLSKPDGVIPGANNTFYASDLPRADMQEANLFHFTNPAVMRSVYRGEGGELVSILQRTWREGLTTSLDFRLPAPGSSPKLVDWTLVLENCLRDVDLLFMNGKDLGRVFGSEADVHSDEELTSQMLDDLSKKVISSGVEVLLVRLGSNGAYLRTAPAPSWKKAGRALAGFGDAWYDQTLWAPAVDGNTTGGEDVHTAGFLSSLLRGEDPDRALLTACAVQISVENDRESILTHLDAGWTTLPLDLSGEGWRKEGPYDLWRK